MPNTKSIERVAIIGLGEAGTIFAKDHQAIFLEIDE